MDCRILQVEQGSDEHWDLRRTRITCSRLADVMAGKETKRYQRYRMEKTKELLGHKNVEENPAWAEHGRRNEPYALAGYEYKFKQEIEHNIFLISNEFDWLSCSPDFLHLPGYTEGGEIKDRELYKNYRKFKALAIEHQGTIRVAPACDRHQVQGAMWVTGLPRWFYINFYIGKDFNGVEIQRIHRQAVPRDDELIEAMEVRCLEFMKECYEEAGLA